MPSSKTKPSPSDPMRDARWIANYLDISVSGVRRLWRDGDLPVVRVGKKAVRARQSAVVAYSVARETTGGVA